ncbi:LytR/AlgR family response regulator transcription factor [Sphingobacterium kitahiroshimense]|uniref:Response regulator transcription factor n=1 Tax=Sphingobacterium kitahiroshimense TaxID=470446 RepID=A0ABV0BPC0_9SPHI
MRTLIVDDEPIAREIIRKLASKIPFLEIVGSCDDAFSALEVIHKQQPDLIFLDIQMPGMTGVDMLRLVERNGIQIIFTTAYHEYALDGFDLDITDYLLKPIPFERFLQAVNKAHISFLKGQKMNQSEDVVKTDREFIWVKEGKKLVQIRLLDIVMVRAMADYMEFIMAESKVLVHITMAKLEMIMPSPTFIRVNRSTMVRQCAIRSIEDLQIETILPEQERISIGPSYADTVKKHIKEMF